MKTKRKFARQPASANVVSLAAVREARARASGAAVAAHAALRPASSAIGLYCRWLALAGAMWTFWW